MFLEAYVADLGEDTDEPFSLDEGDWSGHFPGRISELFPPERSGSESPFMKICGFVAQKTYKGAQTDWGTWVVVVTKQDITAFLSDVYGDEPEPLGMEHLNKQLTELREFVAVLDDSKHYALVAQES